MTPSKGEVSGKTKTAAKPRAASKRIPRAAPPPGPDLAVRLRRAEAALREADLKFRIIAGATGQLTYDYDIQSGRIAWGGAVREVTGCAPEEFTPGIAAWEDLIHPEDRAEAVRLLARAMKEGTPYRAEYRFRFHDGSYRNIRDAGDFVRDAVGRVRRMFGTMADISALKREAKVREAVYQISELTNRAENLQQLFRSIHATIGELMPARNFYIALVDSAEGTIRFPYFVDEYDEAPTPKRPGKGLTEYVLRTGQPLLADPGKTAELEREGAIELIGAPSIDWLGVPLRVRERTIGVMVVQTYTEGVRYGAADRDVLTFVSHQAALAIERKQALDERREAERFLASIFTNIQDGISILDTEYTILRVNGAMERWYAHALPLVGKKCYAAFRNRTSPCEVCPARQTIETSRAAYEVVPLTGAGGGVEGWLDLFSFPLVDAETGRNRGVIEYVRDITSRKEAEESLKASLHEKEVLLKEIHHRVKNNMQVISSLLSLQSRHLQDPAAIAMFRESQHRIRSMALVHEKLYQSQDLSRIDFASYLENLLVYLFHAYPLNAKGVRLRTDVAPFTLDINTAIPCGLLISELVTNALKHAFPGGGGGEILVSLQLRDGGRFLLTVKDTGVGYPSGLDFRAPETFGMQLVSMLLQQLDGTISMTAAPGAGTEFRVEFAPLKYPTRL